MGFGDLGTARKFWEASSPPCASKPWSLGCVWGGSDPKLLWGPEEAEPAGGFALTSAAVSSLPQKGNFAQCGNPLWGHPGGFMVLSRDSGLPGQVIVKQSAKVIYLCPGHLSATQRGQTSSLGAAGALWGAQGKLCWGEIIFTFYTLFLWSWSRFPLRVNNWKLCKKG